MINKLIDKIRKTNAPVVVGLDPMLNYIPKHIQEKAFAEYGETLEGAAEAIWQFNKGIVDATCDLIPAVKPQIAMYEQFGIPGLQAYKKTVDYCKEKDLVIIGDIKRGDIGSTSAAYAVGHLGRVQVGSKTYTGFGEDFATVNPYLGTDGVKPFIEVCKEENKGLFILVKLPIRQAENFRIESLTDVLCMSGLARRLHSGARRIWARVTAILAQLSVQLIRKWAGCCVKLCRKPLF